MKAIISTFINQEPNMEDISSAFNLNPDPSNPISVFNFIAIKTGNFVQISYTLPKNPTSPSSFSIPFKSGLFPIDKTFFPIYSYRNGVYQTSNDSFNQKGNMSLNTGIQDVNYDTIVVFCFPII